jgi:hypothetical protein
LACLAVLTIVFCASRLYAAQSRKPQRHEDGNDRASTRDAPSAVTARQPPVEVANRDREDVTRHVQDVVEALKLRLSIPDSVVVSLVPKNPLVVSVERANGRAGTFVLSLEDGFIRLLTDDELDSVVAHELGHVWIFTHHPYLQTEELANQVAMRIVSRESLVRVYDKVWERTGSKGTLAYVPGK